MSRRISSIECLETRRLFSHGADDPILIADRNTIGDDKALYVTHRHELEVQLGDDRRGMIEAEHQRDLDVAPLVQKLTDDVTTGRAELVADVSALRSTVLDDRVSIHDIIDQAHRDRGDATAFATDVANLTAAKAAYLSHVLSGRATIQQHHDDLVTHVHDDRLAISTYLHTDSAGMIAARQQYEDDHQNGLNELNDDRGRVNDDIAKFHDDDGPNHT